ncbi:hypothetical protein QLS71_016890 [Mariniflexile litorale]|uniref:N-acetyltransferase domain-containing protein n=1 Tax=Mariniflexile litorale TaxID=3045158 RepID=A0AAU7EEC2_9FLAO|nr:hypothetical protein [Mariniflexile sp. KMM 9835]MDQ8211521.1 hypothetical protein [Mariniflexile sp. KMM 9835]
MNPNLKVVALSKTDLVEAIHNNTYWQDERILMPKSKALWLIKNNTIEDDAYVAIICLENNVIISYLLTIPDTIHVVNAGLKKMYWMHEWWVDHKFQGSIVPSYLFNQAAKKLSKNILIESNAENSDSFFNSQFNTIHTKTRHTIFFLLESTVLINRFPFLKYFKFLITIANSTFVRVLNSRNYKKTQKSLVAVQYEYLNELDPEAWNFIEPRCKNDFTYKTQENINWYIDNSQYTQTPINKRFKSVFSTTGFSNNIHNHSFKIIKNGEIIGFISYLFNMIEFNVKYFLPKDDAHYEICMDALMEHCLKAKATYIITDDTKLSNEINKKYTALFTYKKEKKSRVHKGADVAFNEIILTDRDGRFH